MRSGLAALAALSALCCTTANGQVVVSQIYGGSSSTGSTYQRDYVELFNRGTTTVNLSTWSLQYASSTGTTWTKVNLTGSIAPGGYYLFAGATNTSGVALPVTPDLSGTLDLSSTTGKVALVANQTALPTGQFGAAPATLGVVDFVAYGASAAGVAAFEGSGPTGTNASTVLSISRLSGGCTDSNNNPADFAAPATPTLTAPRNTSSAANPCATPTGGCCLPTTECRTLSASACATAGGTYAGDFTTCTAGSYTTTSNAVAFDDLTTQTAARTNLATAQADDASQAAQNIPFPFYYFGSPVSRYSVNSNGWMAFFPQTSATNYGTGETIPAIAAPNMVMSVYRRDLNGTGKNCWQLVKGTAPNRQLVIQWDQYVPFGGTALNTFEVILNETSNVIEYRYATLAGGAPNVCGLEEVSGTVGVLVPTASVVSNASFQFTPVNECPVTGACCNAGACSTSDSLGCTVSGGVFSGAGSSCSPNPCATGACCLPTGSCAAQTAGQCAGNAGVYQGTGAVCGATACPATGSCCVGTTCSVGFQSLCTGVFTAAGTCTTNLCASPCCNGNTAACTLVATTGGTCAGTLGTAGATCAATVCPSGSCCTVATGVCAVTGPTGCSGVYGGTGSTCTTVPCAPPPNDNCLLVEPVGFHYTSNFTVSGQANSATNDGSFAAITGGTFGCAATNTATTTNSAREVYFSFVPSANGSLNVDLCSTLPSYDSVLSVHTGCPANGANTIGCNDDGACTGGVGLSQVLGVPVTAGNTYIIRVARYGTGTTTGYTYTLQATTAAVGACCKPDTSCIVATAAGCAASPNLGSYRGDATTCGAVVCTGACCDNTTAVCTATSSAACGAGSTFSGVGSSCTPSPCVGQACCSNATGTCTLIGNSGTCAAGSTSAGPNTTCSPTPCSIHVCCNDATGACTVFGSDPCPSGSTTNAATSCTVNPCPQPPPPANDTCSSAIALTLGTLATGDNTFAVSTNDGPASTCTTANNHGVWFKFTTTADAGALYRVDTCGSTLPDTVITVYGGVTCASDATTASGTQVGCNDDNAAACTGSSGLNSAVLDLALTPSSTYYVRVSSFGTVGGAYNVLVQRQDPAGVCCDTTTFACSFTYTAGVCPSGSVAGSGITCAPTPCAPPGVCCRGATCNTTITTASACGASITSGTAGSAFPNGTACNGAAVSNTPCCYGDYNKVGGITVTDIFNFLSDWFAGSSFANVGGDGSAVQLTVQNIFDFLSNWFTGCP